MHSPDFTFRSALKWISVPPALGFFALLAACSTLDVHSDRDPKTDFTKYQSYAWMPKDKSAEASDVTGQPSDLVEARIHQAVEAQLKTRGLRPVDVGTGEKPDVYVTDHVSHKEKVEADGGGTNFGFGYGFGPWYGAGFGTPYASARQYTEGTLVIDVVDAKTNQLVWRGIATDQAADPEKSAEKVDKAVAETFKKYPSPTGSG